MNIGILLLAAGSSSRMGRPKQLLPVGATTLIRHCLETALATPCSEVYCVLGAHATIIRPHIEHYPVQLIENPHYQQGLSSSLRAGLTVLEEEGMEAALVLLADMPSVNAAHLHTLIEKFLRDPLQPVATAYLDGPGVPVVFPVSYFSRLKALKGDKGARALLSEEAHSISSIPFEDLTDIDTPGDYQAFMRKQQE